MIFNRFSSNEIRDVFRIGSETEFGMARIEFLPETSTWVLNSPKFRLKKSISFKGWKMDLIIQFQ